MRKESCDLFSVPRSRATVTADVNIDFFVGVVGDFVSCCMRVPFHLSAGRKQDPGPDNCQSFADALAVLSLGVCTSSHLRDSLQGKTWRLAENMWDRAQGTYGPSTISMTLANAVQDRKSVV